VHLSQVAWPSLAAVHRLLTRTPRCRRSHGRADSTHRTPRPAARPAGREAARCVTTFTVARNHQTSSSGFHPFMAARFASIRRGPADHIAANMRRGPRSCWPFTAWLCRALVAAIGRRVPKPVDGHAGTTYGKFLSRRSLDTDGLSPEGTAVPATRDSITSGALSASVRPLRAAKPYVAGVPTT
jgi:hypothetical protein